MRKARRPSSNQQTAAQNRLRELLAEPEPLATLQKRLEALVASANEGSVNAAAQLVGVPLSTMQRIHSGVVSNPRVSILQRIARAYRTTIDWLLSGDGPLPEILVHDAPIALHWWNILDQLQLPRHINDAVRELPYVGFDFWRWGLEGAAPRARRRALEQALAVAIDYDYRAWIIRFDALILTFGRAEARRILIRAFEFVERRFTAEPDAAAHAARADERVAELGAGNAAADMARMRDWMTGRAHEFTSIEEERVKATAAAYEAAYGEGAQDDAIAAADAAAAVARARKLGLRDWVLVQSTDPAPSAVLVPAKKPRRAPTTTATAKSKKPKPASTKRRK